MNPLSLTAAGKMYNSLWVELLVTMLFATTLCLLNYMDEEHGPNITQIIITGCMMAKRFWV